MFSHVLNYVFDFSPIVVNAFSLNIMYFPFPEIIYESALLVYSEVYRGLILRELACFMRCRHATSFGNFH